MYKISMATQKLKVLLFVVFARTCVDRGGEGAIFQMGHAWYLAWWLYRASYMSHAVETTCRESSLLTFALFMNFVIREIINEALRQNKSTYEDAFLMPLIVMMCHAQRPMA